jgi:hypothetical protein
MASNYSFLDRGAATEAEELDPVSGLEEFQLAQKEFERRLAETRPPEADGTPPS